jgi:hypothetical protein
LLLAAAPLLSGCGNFWQAPTTTSTCTTNCSTASSSDFYILNGNSSSGAAGKIAGYTINSGALAAISNSSESISGGVALAMAPNGNFLCVSSASSGVVSFPITSGALGTAVNASGDLEAALIQVDQTNSWLVEAIPGTNQVGLTAYPISSTTGANAGNEYPPATFNVTNAATQNQGGMVISPANNYIFLALGEGGTLVVPFNASPGTGVSPFGSGKTIPVAYTGGSALSVAVDPTNRLFYIGETLADSAHTSGGLRVFEYSSLSTCNSGTCSLTEASGSPIASGGLAPNFILPAASGDYVYVANGQGSAAGNITGFTVTATSIALDTTVAAGADPMGMAEDSTGTYVFEVGSSGSPYFDAYTFDSTTAGKLDSQVTSTAQAASIAIVAVP